MSTPISEAKRYKLLSAYIGDVRAWKADDAAETIIFAAKDPAKDPDDTSFYSCSQTGIITYLGTTSLGKDGGCQPIVFNDGRIAVLLTETPLAGQSGSLADLYLVFLNNKLPSEPPIASAGTIDTAARASIKQIANVLYNAATAIASGVANLR